MSRAIHHQQTTISGINITAAPLDPYLFHDMEETGVGGISYVGYMDEAGKWLLKKMVEGANTIDMTYANISNNVLTPTYALAWTTRASLNYDDLEDITL